MYQISGQADNCHSPLDNYGGGGLDNLVKNVVFEGGSKSEGRYINEFLWIGCVGVISQRDSNLESINVKSRIHVKPIVTEWITSNCWRQLLANSKSIDDILKETFTNDSIKMILALMGEIINCLNTLDVDHLNVCVLFGLWLSVIN